MPALPPTPSTLTPSIRPMRQVFRLCAAVSLAVAVALTVTPAHAATLPFSPSSQSKLDKLNKKADKLVDQYDKAKADLDAAKKRLKAIKKQVADEKHRYQDLHTRVAQLAAEAYKNGTADADMSVLVGDDPNAALNRMSTFVALSNDRSQELKDLLASTQRLNRELAEEKSTTQDVKDKAAKLKKQKEHTESAIAKQKAAMGGTSSHAPSVGGTYNGPASGSARAALDYAYAQKGKPYHYGGTGPDGFDCSGLVMMAWRAGGVSLPRVVPDQYNATRRVSRANLQPGDLVFFSGLGHVGLYVGNNEFIHAPRTGEYVRIDSMSGYWSGQYYGAGRP